MSTRVVAKEIVNLILVPLSSGFILTVVLWGSVMSVLLVDQWGSEKVIMSFITFIVTTTVASITLRIAKEWL